MALPRLLKVLCALSVRHVVSFRYVVNQAAEDGKNGVLQSPARSHIMMAPASEGNILSESLNETDDAAAEAKQIPLTLNTNTKAEEDVIQTLRDDAAWPFPQVSEILQSKNTSSEPLIAILDRAPSLAGHSKLHVNLFCGLMLTVVLGVFWMSGPAAEPTSAALTSAAQHGKEPKDAEELCPDSIIRTLENVLHEYKRNNKDAIDVEKDIIKLFALKEKKRCLDNDSDSAEEEETIQKDCAI